MNLQALTSGVVPRWASTVANVTANIVLVPGEHTWNSGYLQTWKDRFATLGKVFFCQESPLDVLNLVSYLSCVSFAVFGFMHCVTRPRQLRGRSAS